MTTSHVRMHVYSYTMQGQYYSAPYLQAFLSRSPHLSAENKHTLITQQAETSNATSYCYCIKSYTF